MTSGSDDFNRANSGTMGPLWTEWSNGFSVSANRATPDSVSTCGGFVTTNLDTDDHEFEITIANTLSATSIGVGARFGTIGTADTSAGSGYLFRYNGTDVNILKKTASSNTYTAIGTLFTVTLVAGDKLKIRCVGAVIEGYINSVLRVQVTDGSPITGQRHVGMRVVGSTTQAFDDATWADYSTATTAPPPPNRRRRAHLPLLLR